VSHFYTLSYPGTFSNWNFSFYRWLLYSQGKEPNFACEKYATCSGCGINFEEFRTKSDFLEHISVCDGKLVETKKQLNEDKEKAISG
jgi:hypothetical protein